MTASDRARGLLESIVGYGADDHGAPAPEDRPVKIGTVASDFDATTDSGARITFDGESTTSLRRYPWLGTAPKPGERVVLLPVGRSLVILGPIGQPSGPVEPTLATDPVFIGTASGSQPRARYWRDEHGIVSIVGVHAKGASYGMGITLPVGFRPPADYWGADARTGTQYVIRAAGGIESTNNTAGDVVFAFRFPSTAAG